MLPISCVSTGIKGLDNTLNYLQRGDNVVFQVDKIADYKIFVSPFIQAALAKGQRVVYMRFAQHSPLLESAEKVVVYKLNADSGFESFSTQIHNIIRKEGRGVFYVFDCLSDLLLNWATDLMVGNFFLITCPFLFELYTIAYFSILRSHHSYETIARIRETTQVLLDVYNYQGGICVHPLKAWQRYSPAMFLPHIMEKDELIPITNSSDAANFFSSLAPASATSAERNLDHWDRLFMQGHDLLVNKASSKENSAMIEELSHVLIGRETRMLALVKKYFTLHDLIDIKERLIGTGFIGGKSAGMLLARNILRNDNSLKWSDHLELHDSFYIGSDVFYSYLVQNDLWKALMFHKTKEGYFESALELKSKILKGAFSKEIRERFQLMLEYYGQAPIIVRSSSLLEDAFGNAFAGKYESYFCANQGTPEERFEKFEDVVRKVYASTMNIDALTYRLQKGLDQQDEQMALLVQRVSGSYRKSYFFPELAGVGLSYNPFVWQKGMDPQAGMLRLVLGLGTRAVSRVENDYPRIVALDEPLVKPYTKQEDAGRFSQHGVDVLNLEENSFQSLPVSELIKDDLIEHLNLIGSSDIAASEQAKALGKSEKIWTLTFDELLSSTEFSNLMSRMMKRLEEIYDYPVDIEFTANFNAAGKIQINLLQCRPFQTKGHYSRVEIPGLIDEGKVLLRQEGNFMGGSVYRNIAQIIYVDPAGYAKLSLTEKYNIARVIGKINKTINPRDKMPTILFGPGRWGTSTPTMGVPVTFSEINNVAAIAEIANSDGSLMPELSFGTHFFQDLVEMDIFYLAIYPEKENVIFNKLWLKKQLNILKDLVPDDKKYADVIRVCNVQTKDMLLIADIVSQKVVCFAQA